MARFLFLFLFALFGFNLSRAPAGATGIAEGEIRVQVMDPTQEGVPARITLEGRSPRLEIAFLADNRGTAVLRRLPFGTYRLEVTHPGFRKTTRIVEVHSAVVHEISVMLELEPTETLLTVETTPPLINFSRPGWLHTVDREQLRRLPGGELGRGVIHAVTTLPGWLLEANAVLHPRGSEYDTQYVLDGLPLYENRSLAFSPAFEVAEFESVTALTGGFPAEYGRRLGGVIALDTRRVEGADHDTEIRLETGSYSHRSGTLNHFYQTGATGLTGGGYLGGTHRYLDPPSPSNFTNRATARGAHLRLDRELIRQDHLSVYLRTSETDFLVPNTLEQQRMGQRQDHETMESSLQLHYRHDFSSGSLASTRFMFRKLRAGLTSNALATPAVGQARELREGLLASSLTIETPLHTFKVGGDIVLTRLAERFRLDRPDPDPHLQFQDEQRATQISFYVQDYIRWNHLAVGLGLRYDHHHLLQTLDAFSPRLGLSYWVPDADLLFRASYDRIFQTPPFENLLLSSAASGLALDAIESSLPVPSSRAHYFEVGLSKPLFNTFRIDVSQYWRTFDNYMDDDLFLNTGLAFPISFASARIRGTEARLDLPRWRGFSGTVSYSNLLGYANSPVTGGLFVEGGEAEELRNSVERFPVSQDQRNTVAALLSFRPTEQLWISVAGYYGSGLPVELADDDEGEKEEEEATPVLPSIEPDILQEVNFERGRLRPNSSLDLSVGFRPWRDDRHSLSLQFAVRNLLDQLNVINFSGLFSGTALGPGRHFVLQTRFDF